jgi:hypothetical protein
MENNIFASKIKKVRKCFVGTRTETVENMLTALKK